MNDAGDAQRCGRCGAEFTATSTPLGLCPACLLKLGMSDPAMTPAQEPEPEPVAPLPSAAPPGPAPPAPLARRLRLPSRRVWITAAAVLVLVVASQFFPRLQRREATGIHVEPVRFTLTLPDETEIADGAQFAVSADGTQLVVAARQAGGPQRLWLRRLQSTEWRELSRTDGATFPFWSPDSRHVGFFTDRRLMRIDVANGLTQTLCDVRSGQGGTWSNQGIIVFADDTGVSRVPASGGAPVAVTKVDSSDSQRAHLWPHFLPDGRHFVFLVQKENDKVATHVGSVDTAESMTIADGRGPSAFVADVLLFARGTTLATQRFDQTTGVIGEMETLGGVEEIAGSITAGSAFSASSTVLVYRREEERRRQLTWFDREGRHVGVVGEPAEYTGFALSPDGRRLAFARRGEEDASSVWLMDLAFDRLARLTTGRRRDAFPLWSPDGSRIAFSSRGSDGESLHAIVADTGEMDEVLFRSPESKHLTDWSVDNRFLIYAARSPKAGMDLWLLPTMGERKPQPFHQTPANESQGRSSPDGRWIAYVSDESGSEEVYVRAFPPSEGRWQISTAGGRRPRWRSDGRELFFLSTDGQLMAVDVTSGPTPRYEAPRRVLDVRGADDFAVSRDGRFLVPLPLNESRDRELHVVLNWGAERRR